MQKVIYCVLIITLLMGIFVAIYLRQPTGFFVSGSAILAFAYVFIKGKE